MIGIRLSALGQVTTRGLVGALVAGSLMAGAGTGLPARAGDINTASITAATAAGLPACLNWMPVGVCFWLTCTPFGCTINTSVKVGHYNPDLVVTAYHGSGVTPWVEMRAVTGTVGYAGGQAIMSMLGATVPIDAGIRHEDTMAREHRNMIFKEADVFGHPVASLSSMWSESGYLCKSATTSFQPYFLSTLDAFSWRTGGLEVLFPQSWLPGLREIGTLPFPPFNTWGAVYPRTGYVTQAEGPKAGAVAAQRAGDIVTRSMQPHIYIPVDGGATTLTWPELVWVPRLGMEGEEPCPAMFCRSGRWEMGTGGQRVWRPPPLQERDMSTRPARRSGLWQMLTPWPLPVCEAFGSPDLVSWSGWSGGKVDAGESYAWTLWRPYTCCKKAGQIFLESVDVIDYPP